MPLNQQAFRSGSLGILSARAPSSARTLGVLGALPPAPVFRDGILGSLAPAPAFRDGVLGALPPAPAFRDGSLGMPIVYEPLQRRVTSRSKRPRPHLSLRQRFATHGVGEYFAQNGFGADATATAPATTPAPASAVPVQPMVVALGGLAVVATGWYLLNRKRRGRA